MPIDVSAVLSLQAEWTPGESPLDVRRLPLRKVEVLPTIYQARVGGRETRRGVADKGHAASLAALLKDQGRELDPITVLRIGKRNIVIDGHHRLEAYRLQKRKEIPVEWFTDSPAEALIESGLENAKSRLEMTAWDRTERAWELVCADIHSIARIVAGSSVSSRQVSYMRKRWKQYLSDGIEPPAKWYDVKREAYEADDSEGVPLRVNEIVEKMVKALNAALGPSGTFHTTGKLGMLADALHAWGPKAMAHVHSRLFYAYKTSDELLAHLEMERDELLDEIRPLVKEVNDLRNKADDLDEVDF